MLIVPAVVVIEVRAQPPGQPATGGSGKVNGTPNTNVGLVVASDTVATLPAVTVTVATPTGVWKVLSMTQTSALQNVSAPAVGAATTDIAVSSPAIAMTLILREDLMRD